MIAIISGTNRPGSNTRRLADQVKNLYGELDIETRLLDLAELPPEIFHPGAYAEKPESFKAFSQTILEADGLVVISPEYNGGMPGVLKYFIDMLEFPASFERRPVCFIGLAAGQWGALRPVEQLQAVFGYRNAYIFPGRVFIPGVFDQIGEDGRLKDEELIERLKKQAAEFVEFARRLSS